MSSLDKKTTLSRQRFLIGLGSALGVGAAGSLYAWLHVGRRSASGERRAPSPAGFLPRLALETSGFNMVLQKLATWSENASLQEVADAYREVESRLATQLDGSLQGTELSDAGRAKSVIARAELFDYVGDAKAAYDVLSAERQRIENQPEQAREFLYTLIFFQGVTGLRRGENDNCVLCIGDSSCLLPIVPTAVHKKPEGSQSAIRHFTEYLAQFPADLEVKWLLNLAHMTLGEHPDKVNPAYLVPLDNFTRNEFNLGKFREISNAVGITHMNQAGGGIMEDFDNDGLLDIVTTSMDATQRMTFYRNKGDGTFEDRTEAAGLADQWGGLNCVQTDYNNDGHTDIFIPRSAWVLRPVRPSLLRNNGDGTFTDVTKEAGLLAGVTSGCAIWADYDNDGFLDLFICNESQPNMLYHNNGDGTFTEVGAQAGVAGKGGMYKGAAWVDYDNDDFPDLFVNNLHGAAELYHNNGDGTFTEATAELGIDGPEKGFSCWAWDFDNDGWLDIFATSYDRSVEDVVKGMLGQPHQRKSNKLWRNKQGKGFEDVARPMGLDSVFAAMGSNFGDFDNDGFLDLYLGTGDPNYATLIPNRMFKNVGGQRFVEITASAGTGHLQKGHGVACGDWDNDGNVDIFIEMGGSAPGDKFHNLLFQNPGQGNNWLTVKLIGKKTNRAAIGARIKAVTDTPTPLTVHRHVSTGSSFGANPLQQTIGLAKANRVATLEVRWPTSRTTQIFHDIAVNQFIEITEFETNYRTVERRRVPAPNK